jgi:transposase-like protein
MDLPSAGTDGVDIDRLHRLIRQEGVETPGAAANQLQTTADIVRLTLENRPAPRQRRQPAPPKVTVARPSPAYQKAVSMLTRERFIQLYQTDGQSLTHMAATIGVSRRTLAGLARDYGIPTARGQNRHFVDRMWLYDQHVIRGRSISELARELGMPRDGLSWRAHRYGIPVRALSRYSASTLSSNPRVPTILVPVLATQGGWERIQCLPEIPRHDSLAAAAADLGMYCGRLNRTVSTIERDLRGAILIRSTRHRPQTLTPLGERIVAAAIDLLAQGGPDGGTHLAGACCTNTFHEGCEPSP